MKKFSFFLCFLTILSIMLFTICTPVYSSVTYSYIGNQFNTVAFFDSEWSSWGISTDNSLSVTLTFNSPIPPNLVDQGVGMMPTSWIVSDGSHSFNSLTTGANLWGLQFTTDSSGTIEYWGFTFALVGYAPDVNFYIDGGHQTYYTGDSSGLWSTSPVYGSPLIYAQNLNSRGVWTSNVSSPVPLPATLWLFGSSIAGLVGLVRRRKKLYFNNLQESGL